MRVGRAQLVAVVAAVLCVAAAASITEATDQPPEAQLVRAEVGAPLSLQDGDVVVDDVRVGTRLTRDERPVDRTPGLFVVLRVRSEATGAATFRLGDARLRTTDDVTYDVYGGVVTVAVEPGFATTQDVVFEVDPARLDGLTVELWRAEIVHGFQQRAQVPLGITADNAAAWAAAGAGQSVEVAVLGRTRGAS